MQKLPRTPWCILESRNVHTTKKCKGNIDLPVKQYIYRNNLQYCVCMAFKLEQMASDIWTQRKLVWPQYFWFGCLSSMSNNNTCKSKGSVFHDIGHYSFTRGEEDKTHSNLLQSPHTQYNLLFWGQKQSEGQLMCYLNKDCVSSHLLDFCVLWLFQQ